MRTDWHCLLLVKCALNAALSLSPPSVKRRPKRALKQSIGDSHNQISRRMKRVGIRWTGSYFLLTRSDRHRFLVREHSLDFDTRKMQRQVTALLLIFFRRSTLISGRFISLAWYFFRDVRFFGVRSFYHFLFERKILNFWMIRNRNQFSLRKREQIADRKELNRIYLSK